MLGEEVSSVSLDRERKARTTEDGSGPCSWVWHLLVLLNQLGIHACNFSVIYAIEDEFGERIHCWQSRMATAVSFLHRQPSFSPHAWEPVRSVEGAPNMHLPGSLKMRVRTRTRTGRDNSVSAPFVLGQSTHFGL